VSAEVEDLRVALQIAEADRDSARLRVEEMRELAADLAQTLEFVSDEYCKFRLVRVGAVLRRAEGFGLLDDDREEEEAEPDDESEDIDERDIPFLWRPDEPAMGQETDHNPFVFQGLER
jgi:hypothetical protein